MVDRSKLSPDQPVVPGADVIYPPAGQAGEYAPLATNPWKGCGHKCAYCLTPETLIQKADGTASLAIVERTHKFVDLFKIGRANYLQEITLTTDWRDYTLRMVDVCQRLGVRHYIKRDLQPHLPPDYPNPLRIPQHH